MDGTEITTSVKYNLEIDLGKIGKPFQDAFDWVNEKVSNEYFQKFIFVFVIMALAVVVFYSGATITVSALFTMLVSTLTSLMSSIKF